MKKRTALFATLFWSSILLSGCRLPVVYELSSSGRNISQKYGSTVKVAQFVDQSPKQQKAKVKINGQTWKTNYVGAYTGNEYAKGISSMIAKDLQSTGMFGTVVEPSATGTADFELRGTVWDFSAMGQWKTAPEQVMLLGSTFLNVPGAAIAGLATSWIKTDVVTSVILTDVHLIDNRTGKVVWRCPPLRAGSEKRVRWTKADVGPLVKAANTELREVVTQLVNQLNQDAPALDKRHT